MYRDLLHITIISFPYSDTNTKAKFGKARGITADSARFYTLQV